MRTILWCIQIIHLAILTECIRIQFVLYFKFIESTGKSRALFGLIEMGYEYRYLFLLPLILTSFGIYRLHSEFRLPVSWLNFTRLLAFFSVVIPFWKLFV